MKESWIIRKGILAIVVFMAMVLKGVRGGDFGNYGRGHDFNGPDHSALCNVFEATLDLWDASRRSELKLDNGLEKVVAEAIFGNYGTRNLEDFKDTLPRGYHKPNKRGVWCGTCHYQERYYPGRSIPHDLMCLCTPGKYGEPFYGWWWFFGYYYSASSYKLCGKERGDLVKSHNDGWYAEGSVQQAKGLDMSWKTVVMGCFNTWKTKQRTGQTHLEEKVAKLTDAMQKYTAILKESNGRHKLGGMKQHHTESDGKNEKSIHVWYGLCDNVKRPWWKKLNETLRGKTPKELIKSPSQASRGIPSSGSSRVNGTNNRNIAVQKNGLPSMDEDLEGLPEGTNSTQTNGISSMTARLNDTGSGSIGTAENHSAQYQMLRSGTIIIPSFSWFPCAIFLI